jgi:hypothetical protein
MKLKEKHFEAYYYSGNKLPRKIKKMLKKYILEREEYDYSQFVKYCDNEFMGQYKKDLKSN